MDYKVDSLTGFIKRIEDLTKDYSLYNGMIEKFMKTELPTKENLMFKKAYALRELESLLDWYCLSESRANFDWMGQFDDIEEKLNKYVFSNFKHAELIESATLINKIELYNKKIKKCTSDIKKLTRMAKQRELFFFLNEDKKIHLLKQINNLEDNILFTDSERQIFQSICKRINNDPTPLDEDYYSDFFTTNDCDYLCKKLAKFTNTANLRKAVSQIKLDIRTPAQPFQYFYRGESITEWNLRPSALRSDYTWDKESFYYHEIQARCPGEFKKSSFLNNLVTMQHYGCPTRLLDITSSPLIALYFACESNQHRDGTVIIFPIIQGSIAYSDSDKALILSCLSHFSKNEQKSLISEISSINQDKSINYAALPHYNKLIQEIKIEKPSFQAQINIGDLLNPLFVQPNMTNSRILNQHGAFILSGICSNLDLCSKQLNSRVAKHRIIIKAPAKREILKQLDIIGINIGTVYPNIEKVAEYLKSI